MKLATTRTACLVLACGVLCAAAPSATAERPNILVVLCDDLGYGDLACFGSTAIRTPNLDRLAADGLKLTACYSGSPVCSPSRAALMTGRNPNRLGIRDWIPGNSGIYLKAEETTVAERLRDAGYRTGHFGKWHLNSRMDRSEPSPGDHGFDYWFSTQNNAVPTHQNPVNFVRRGKRVGPLRGHSTTLIAEEAMSWVRRSPHAPWAAFVWFHAPHEQIATPEEFSRPYAGQGDSTKADYYGSVSLVDHEVGRLRRFLSDIGEERNTLVFFTSDNGPETLRRYPTGNRSHGSPGPFRGMKLHVTEAGYRVPGILCWPGRTKPGSVSDEPVCGTDLLPTVCDAVGVPPRRPGSPAVPLDGVSILPVLEGKPVPRRKPLYWQYDHAISQPWTLALRDGRWKLLGNAARDRFALYDLRADPSETYDLAREQPAVLARLKAMMIRQQREVNGP